ncbi:PA2169 family four-helix-bundle protein [Henriciella sp. AS95]|uniref:PA2169 family four-helix-bundle protein n=1 Tax=Henriciella sp. AS95 TaxID=3135782 RepID=UPI00316FBDAD
MKKTLLAGVALALPLSFAACSSAGLTPSEQAVAEANVEMSETVQKEVAELNKLTSIYIDAAALYKQAADIPDDTKSLKPALLELAKEKNMQRDLLQDRVLEMGGKPAEHGEALGTVHRGFTSLRTIIDNDTEVAMEEVLRGERYILDELNKAMPNTVTPETKQLLASLRTDAEAEISRLEQIDETI